MASGPITSWQIDGKQRLTLFWGAPKSLQMVTAAMKLKRCLLLERKVMTSLDSILKGRDITLLTKVHLVRSTVLPLVMYGCEHWTIKKLSAEELMLLNCGLEKNFFFFFFFYFSLSQFYFIFLYIKSHGHLQTKLYNR